MNLWKIPVLLAAAQIALTLGSMSAFAGTRTVVIPAFITKTGDGCGVNGDDCGIIIEIPDAPDPGPFPGGCPECDMAVFGQAPEQQLDNDLYQREAHAGPNFPAAFTNVQSVVYSKTGRDITSDIYNHFGLTWYPVNPNGN